MKKEIIKIVFFVLFVKTAVGQKTDNSFKDSTRYIVLSLKQVPNYFFDSSYSEATLSTKEIKIVEALFLKAIKDYNKKISYQNVEMLKNNMDLAIHLSDQFYAKQLVPAINKNGEKEVFINCFASDPSAPPWAEFIHIADGGNQNFTMIVNITKGTFYNVHIGGYG